MPKLQFYLQRYLYDAEVKEHYGTRVVTLFSLLSLYVMHCMKRNHGDSYIVNGTMFPLHAMTFKYVQKKECWSSIKNASCENKNIRVKNRSLYKKSDGAQ